MANTKFVIKTIYDSTWQTFDTNPSCQFDFILKEIVKTPEFEVDAVLRIIKIMHGIQMAIQLIAKLWFS